MLFILLLSCKYYYMYPHDHPLKSQYYPHLQMKRYLLLYYFQILNFINVLGINN